MFKYFIIFPILIFSIQCFAQNPNGKLDLTVNGGCERIVFNIENKEDTVFYSINNDFSLKLSYCYPDEVWHSSATLGTIEYSFVPEGNGQATVRMDSTAIIWNYMVAYKIKIEIKNLHSNKKMVVICNYVPQSLFFLYIEFKEGTFALMNTISNKLIEIKER